MVLAHEGLPGALDPRQVEALRPLAMAVCAGEVRHAREREEVVGGVAGPEWRPEVGNGELLPLLDRQAALDRERDANPAGGPARHAGPPGRGAAEPVGVAPGALEREAGVMIQGATQPGHRGAPGGCNSPSGCRGWWWEGPRWCRSARALHGPAVAHSAFQPPRLRGGARIGPPQPGATTTRTYPLVQQHCCRRGAVRDPEVVHPDPEPVLPRSREADLHRGHSSAGSGPGGPGLELPTSPGPWYLNQVMAVGIGARSPPPGPSIQMGISSGVPTRGLAAAPWSPPPGPRRGEVHPGRKRTTGISEARRLRCGTTARTGDAVVRPGTE